MKINAKRKQHIEPMDLANEPQNDIARKMKPLFDKELNVRKAYMDLALYYAFSSKDTERSDIKGSFQGIVDVLGKMAKTRGNLIETSDLGLVLHSE